MDRASEQIASRSDSLMFTTGILKPSNNGKQSSGVGLTLSNSAYVAIKYANSEHSYIGHYASAFGDRTLSKPTVNGVWRGYMAGIDYVSSAFLTGNVVFNYRGDQGILNATFSNVRRTSDNLPYPIPNKFDFPSIKVNSLGAFSKEYGGGNIQGAFYGVNSEEVTGTFERMTILGAYGTQKEIPTFQTKSTPQIPKQETTPPLRRQETIPPRRRYGSSPNDWLPPSQDTRGCVKHVSGLWVGNCPAARGDSNI